MERIELNIGKVDDFGQIQAAQRKIYNAIIESKTNKITSNGHICAALMDLFEWEPISKMPDNLDVQPIGEKYHCGNLNNVEVWCDPNMNWTDTRIILADLNEIIINLDGILM